MESSRQVEILNEVWQACLDHKNDYHIKTLQKFIYKHIIDLENVQTIINKGEFKGRTISTN